MSGKGDLKRPSQVDDKTFSDNWERIFAAKKDYYAGIREKNYADSLRLEGFSGVPERPKGAGSNPVSDLNVANVGSNPTTAAIKLGQEQSNADKPGFVTGRAIAPDAYTPDSFGRTPIYINADTGEQVGEDWWPTITQ